MPSFSFACRLSVVEDKAGIEDDELDVVEAKRGVEKNEFGVVEDKRGVVEEEDEFDAFDVSAESGLDKDKYE